MKTERLTGFHPLNPEEAADRRRARRPDRDAWYAHRAVAPRDRAPDVVDAAEVPPVLAALESAMGAADRVTSGAVAAVAGMDAGALAASLRPYGVTPSKWRHGDTTERGYTRESLVRALEEL